MSVALQALQMLPASSQGEAVTPHASNPSKYAPSALADCAESAGSGTGTPPLPFQGDTQITRSQVISRHHLLVAAVLVGPCQFWMLWLLVLRSLANNRHKEILMDLDVWLCQFWML